MDEMSVLRSLKNLIEGSSTDVGALSEFMSEISQANSLHNNKVIAILNRIDAGIPSASTNRDTIHQTRTQLSSMTALLMESLKVCHDVYLSMIKLIQIQRNEVVATQSPLTIPLSNPLSTPSKPAYSFLPLTPLSAPPTRSQVSSRANKKCSDCGDLGHFRRDCPNKRKVSSEFCAR